MQIITPPETYEFYTEQSCLWSGETLLLASEKMTVSQQHLWDRYVLRLSAEVGFFGKTKTYEVPIFRRKELLKTTWRVPDDLSLDARYTLYDRQGQHVASGCFAPMRHAFKGDSIEFVIEMAWT